MNNKMLTNDELNQLLNDLKSGAVIVTETNNSLYNGYFHFLTSNGYEIEVFDDAGEPDYIESITKGNTTIGYEELRKFNISNNGGFDNLDIFDSW